MDITNLLNIIEKKKKYHFWIFLGILTSLTLFMIYCYMPLDKISPGHDYMFHYKRMCTLMQALKDGSFPIYLDYNAYEGYGYATKWFYSDFVLIPFAYIANLIGLPTAYKVMYFTMSILCGILTYFATKRIYKNSLGASITGILFTFCTYRLQDLYERFALGEALSFTFIPLVFWGLYEIIKGNYKKWYIISIAFSLLIFTHLLSTVLAFTTIVIIIVFYYKDFFREPKRFLYLVIAGIITLFLTAYYLFPFIEQYQASFFNFQQPNAHTFAQHNRSEVLRIIHGMFSIGFITMERYYFLPSIGVILTFLISLRFFIYDKSKEIKSVDLGVIIGIVYIVSCFNFIPWSLYPLKWFNFIQFPWRLFEFSSFFFALASGYYLTKVLRKTRRSLIAVILLLFLISNSIIMNATSYKKLFDYENSIIEQPTFENRFLLVDLEYFPYRMSGDSLHYIEKKKHNIYKKNIDTEINNIQRIEGGMNFNISINKPDTLELPIIYYKGYYANIDDQDIKIWESKYGLIEMEVNKSGAIHVEFTGTPIQKYSIYITIISYLLLFIYMSWNRKNI